MSIAPSFNLFVPLRVALVGVMYFTLLNCPRQSSGADSDAPWAQSAAKIKALHDLANNAVARVINPETQSEQFPGSTFKGITLLQRFDVQKQRDLQLPMVGFAWPVTEQNAVDAGGAEVAVFVDKASSHIVGIRANYHRSLADMVGDIVDVFGKTEDEIRSFASWNGLDMHVANTRINYVFAKTIVQVTETTTNSHFGRATQTSICVCDRPYVEAALRNYAYAAAVSAAWLLVGLDRVKADGAGLQDVETLTDTVLERSEDVPARDNSPPLPPRGVVCYDKVMRPRVEAWLNVGHYNPPRDPLCFDVGCLYVINGQVRGVCDPRVSASVGLTPLESKNFDYGADGLAPTIADTELSDLFWQVGSIITQQVFPPATDKISVITPKGPTDAGRGPGQSVEDRLFRLGNRVYADRYEWKNEQGWVIQVGRNLAISVFKPAKKGL